MGVYIEGLRMPKQGRYITVTVYNDGTVKFQFGGELAGKAYEVPEKHERLIDADAFAHEVWLKQCEDCTLYDSVICHACRVTSIIEELKQFPTIIKAEGGNA